MAYFSYFINKINYSMKKNTRFWIGKTFDDFLFRPQKGISETRRNISLVSKLSDLIHLELPIVSSNMDSVTASDMARAMALDGGIGVVHRAMSIERQAREIDDVKRSQSAVIENPLCLPLNATIRQAKSFAHKNNITGILIETEPESGILAGLLSGRDIPWDSDVNEHSVSCIHDA